MEEVRHRAQIQKYLILVNLLIPMPDGEEIIIYAVVFIGLFLLGGSIGVACLPPFPGRFFFSGFLLAVFGTGAGSLIINARINR